jgi:hypothetical protein
MRRHILLITALTLLAGSAPLRAGNPPGREGSARLSYGIEWGYDATVIDVYHYNYMDAADGFRIDDKAAKPMFYSNGHATAHLTLEFARRWALGLYAGYAGVQQRTRIFPLALRSTYFMESFRDDGQFLFLEGGAGLHETRKSISPFGRLGYGYRAVLSRRSSIDFSASLRVTADHPPIYDSSIPGYVSDEDIRRSDALYGAVLLSVALNF